MLLPVEERTFAALLPIAVALAGMVADAGAGPHVVHRPYDRFARLQYLADVLQRQHALIYPMQVDDVRLLEFGQGGDVRACVGYVDGKQVMLLETVGAPYHNAFPNESPHHAPIVLQGHNGNLLRLFVTNQQFGFYAVILQGIHQAAGGYGGAAHAFGGIYQQDSHGLSGMNRK